MTLAMVFGTVRAARVSNVCTMKPSRTVDDSHDHRVSFFVNHPEAALVAFNGRDQSQKFLAMRAVLGNRRLNVPQQT